MKECKIEHTTSVMDTTWKRDGSGQRVETKGYNVTIPNAMGSTTTFVEHLSQAFSMIGKYDNEALAIDKRAKEIGQYLTSDEGKWGRQDSFDNDIKF